MQQQSAHLEILPLTVKKFFAEMSEIKDKVGTNIVLKPKRVASLENKRRDTATIDSRSVAFMIANAAEDKKGRGTIVLDVRQITLLADYFVIVGGDTATQVRAIVEGIDESLSEYGYSPRAIEGKKDGRWVLIDYGDIIVHILQEKERNFYKLEQFWNQALIVDRRDWAKD